MVLMGAFLQGRRDRSTKIKNLISTLRLYFRFVQGRAFLDRPFPLTQVEGSKMTNKLTHSIIVTGFNRLINFLKAVSGGIPDLSLADVLVISRILFAIVVVGFLGYFFDQMKLSAFSLEKEAKTHSYK